MSYKLTPHEDVNQVLELLAEGLKELLGGQIVGLYLTGSLTYGDFDKVSSDIDFLAVLDKPLTDQQLKAVKQLHQQIGKAVPFWAKRLEGSYITAEMIKSKDRPEEQRPYVNGGKVNLYKYGNEWTINLYALQETGVAILGKEPREMFPKVTIEDVRAASKQDLLSDWQPKLDDPNAFNHEGYDSNHLKAYAVLTMCRVLHRAKNDGIASKRVTSKWVKETYKEWSSLVERAEQWQHGKQMSSDDEVKDFIRFTIAESKQN
jgi:predicted nucleotidyltransferase